MQHLLILFKFWWKKNGPKSVNTIILQDHGPETIPLFMQWSVKWTDWSKSGLRQELMSYRPRARFLPNSIAYLHATCGFILFVIQDKNESRGPSALLLLPRWLCRRLQIKTMLHNRLVFCSLFTEKAHFIKRTAKSWSSLKIHPRWGLTSKLALLFSRSGVSRGALRSKGARQTCKSILINTPKLMTADRYLCTFYIAWLWNAYRLCRSGIFFFFFLIAAITYLTEARWMFAWQQRQQIKNAIQGCTYLWAKFFEDALQMTEERI